ncbi:leucyl/phenylalanyl-tRNA--protein transferase [Nocardioides sp.]|uniref:leucyl/phenylalanyl-tRNA--protein transferase n=1 Tax=Nocardioides sp. TaxID=35761 RepID=UPI0039E3785D
MPIEPPPSEWEFVDLADPGLDARLDDLVGMGADLAPGTLLAAYRRGLFPMPGERRRDYLWFSPVRRGILPLDGLKTSKSLRRSARDFEIRVDTAFEEVVAACGDPRRPQGWIDERIQTAYGDLHRLGWAHSVEAWRDGELAGGLYGVSIGGLFAGESMFHRQRDASKVALVGLVALLRSDGVEGRLLDVQWSTPHLASLGVVEVPRRSYLELLAAALELPDAFAGDQTT